MPRNTASHELPFSSNIVFSQRGIVTLAHSEHEMESSYLAFDQGKVTRVRVVSPSFYDPENVRLKG